MAEDRGPWFPAFYDEEDDEIFTWRVYVPDSPHDIGIEMLSLSPLRTAHERFEDRPDLYDVIFDAQQRQEAGLLYHPERGGPTGGGPMFLGLDFIQNKY